MVQRSDSEMEALQRKQERREEQKSKDIERLIKSDKQLRAAMLEFVERQRNIVTEDGKLTLSEKSVKSLGGILKTGLVSGVSSGVTKLTGNMALGTGAGVAAGAALAPIGMLSNLIMKKRLAARNRKELENERQRELDEEFEALKFKTIASKVVEERRAEGKKDLHGAALIEVVKKGLRDTEFIAELRRQFDEQKAFEVSKEGQALIQLQEENQKILSDLRDLGLTGEKREQEKDKRNERLRKQSRARGLEDRFEARAGPAMRGRAPAGRVKGGKSGGGLFGGIGTMIARMAIPAMIAGTGAAFAGLGAMAAPIALGGAALGGAIAAVGAGIGAFAWLGSGIGDFFKDFSEGFKSFQSLDGKKLGEVGKGLGEFSSLQFIGMVFGKLLNELSGSNFAQVFGDFTAGLKEFQTLDGKKLEHVGKGVSELPILRVSFAGAIGTFANAVSQLFGGKSVGQIFSDFAMGLRGFEAIDGERLTSAGRGLKGLGTELKTFSEAVPIAFFSSIGRGLADLFGTDTVDMLTELGTVGPGLESAAKGLKEINKLGEINFGLKFNASEMEVDKVVNFAKSIKQRAGDDMEAIVQFSEGLKTLEKFKIIDNTQADRFQNTMAARNNALARSQGQRIYQNIINNMKTDNRAQTNIGVGGQRTAGYGSAGVRAMAD